MKLAEFLQDVGRPVAFYPSIARLVGDVKAAILLCQLIYWTGHQQDPEGWIYKTVVEIETETGLTYKEQRRARRLLIQRGVLREKYRRSLRRFYYQVVTEQVNKLWEQAHPKKDTAPPAQMAYAQRATAQMDVREVSKGQIGTFPKGLSPSTLRESGNTMEQRIQETTARESGRNDRPNGIDLSQPILAAFHEFYPDSRLALIQQDELVTGMPDIERGRCALKHAAVNGCSPRRMTNLIQIYERREWEKDVLPVVAGDGSSSAKRESIVRRCVKELSTAHVGDSDYEEMNFNADLQNKCARHGIRWREIELVLEKIKTEKAVAV